jgi:NTE family protein
VANPPSSQNRKDALVLPAGGARAAYQVGALRYVARNFPEFDPRIFTGISAGSINCCFLAQGEPFTESTEKLYTLWSDLTFDRVFRTNFRSLFAMGMRWIYDLFLSKVSNRLLLRSMLDASPLSYTLLEHIHFWKITKAIRAGRVQGLAVTATNYHTGSATVFFDAPEHVKAWRREMRVAERTSIRVRHIMASCSIPILFEPIRIGSYLFGDGSMRFNFPFSPAIHLGATHILSISIRAQKPVDALGYRPDQVGLGFVAGAVLNSIFLDSLEQDFESLQRMNEIQSERVRPVQALVIRPSEDPANIARQFRKELPFHLRQLLGATGSPNELGDLLSYLLFSPGYLRALLDLGERDAASQHDRIKSALQLAGQMPSSIKA